MTNISLVCTRRDDKRGPWLASSLATSLSSRFSPALYIRYFPRWRNTIRKMVLRKSRPRVVSGYAWTGVEKYTAVGKILKDLLVHRHPGEVCEFIASSRARASFERVLQTLWLTRSDRPRTPFLRNLTVAASPCACCWRLSYAQRAPTFVRLFPRG